MEPSENRNSGTGEAVTFPNPNFKRAIRKALGKTKGRVYRSDLARLTRLCLNYKQISDISPLAHLISLTTLHLHDNQISDVSPLVMLPWITWLDVSENQVSRIRRSCLGMLMMFRAPRLVRRCCWSLSNYLTMFLEQRPRIP
jgi:hypothetical protein